MFGQYSSSSAIFCILKDLKRHSFSYISQLVTEKEGKIPIYLQCRATKVCQKNLKISDMIGFNNGIFCKRTFSQILRVVLYSSDLSFKYKYCTTGMEELTIFKIPAIMSENSFLAATTITILVKRFSCRLSFVYLWNIYNLMMKPVGFTDILKSKPFWEH